MSELFHEFLSTNFTITQEIKKSSKSKIVLAINKLTNQPCIIKYLHHTTSPYNELKNSHIVVFLKYIIYIKMKTSLLLLKNTSMDAHFLIF